MVKRRNQHYVPQHYLRAWATDEKLNVLPLSTGETFREITKSVCSRNYFYGNPPTVETELANLDGHHANSVRELLDLIEVDHHYGGQQGKTREIALTF